MRVIQPVDPKDIESGAYVFDGGKMLVYYSLGNFRADQAQSEETKRGAEAVFTIAHTYDGVALLDYDTKEINAYWK